MNKQIQRDYYKTLNLCSICLEKIGKKHLKKTKCNHTFHYKCLDIWVQNNNSCPNCREPIYENIIFFFSTTQSILGRNQNKIILVLLLMMFVFYIYILSLILDIPKEKFELFDKY